MPTTDSPSTRTRAATRRSSITIEPSPLVSSRPRRSVRKPIIIDSDSDEEICDKSYRDINIDLRRHSIYKKGEPRKQKKEIEVIVESQEEVVSTRTRRSGCRSLIETKTPYQKKDVELILESPEKPRLLTSRQPDAIQTSDKRLLTPKKRPNNENAQLSDSDLSSANTTPINLTPRKTKSIQDIENVGCVTPPKQKKIGHRNNENILFSPTNLFKKLELNSPKKTQLVFEDLEEQKRQDMYKDARKALHSTVPVEMPGREKEHEQLRHFIKTHLLEETSGSLYVSGPPGTGKTASLSKILQEPDICDSFKEIYVNCTAIKSSGSIYSRIVKELGIKSTGKTEKECILTIESHLKRNRQMILLVLDEIDQLESKKQSVLYTIFEWPSKPEARLILIGIANALDLTDRILPRLQANCALKPRLMHFAPYSKAQIVEIFTNRLKTAGVLELFQPVAMQMLAGKVAAISGDVRRALDIGRRVIEIAEQRKRQEALKAIENTPNGELAKVVNLQHVVGVLNSVYGTSDKLNSDECDDSFPLQQKIVVCTLLLIIKKAKNKDVTIGRLHGVYRKVCQKRNLLAVDQAEFVGICSLIETRGILRVSGKKEPRLHKITLQWDEEEVSAALRDKQLMSQILQDTAVLGNM